MATDALASTPESGINHSNYGTLLEEDKEAALDTIEFKDGLEGKAFWNRLEAWAAPSVLFQHSWVILLRILVPGLFVSMFSLSTGRYSMKCREYAPLAEEYSMPNVPRAFCELTGRCVVLFPLLCRVFAIGLVSWCMLRQRLYYVCLRHKIHINFEQPPRIARNVLLILVVMLFFAICHFKIIASWGRDLNGNLLLSPDESLSGFVLHPKRIWKKKYRRLGLFVTDVLSEYLFPAMVALYFIHKVGDVSENLIPITNLFDSSSEEACEICSETFNNPLAVHETVLREVLHCNDENATNDNGTKFRKLTRTASMTDAFGALQKQAVAYQGAIKLDGDFDPERAATMRAGRKETTLPSFGLLDLVCKRWWPLEILMKPDAWESDSDSFRTTWGRHCLLCVVFLAAEFAWRVKRLVGQTVKATSSEPWFGEKEPLNGWLFNQIASFPILLLLIQFIWAFGTSAYNNLLQIKGAT